MSEILFLAHRLPFPPDRGDKIRSHHVLKALARLAPVHVATFADDPADMAHEGALAAIAASHCLVRRSKPLPLAGIEALVRGEPVSLPAFRDARIAAYVSQTLAERPISAIWGFSGQMGQYLPATHPARVVFDLCDVDSAKFETYGEQRRAPRAWIDRREGHLLAREEARIARRADLTLLISREEAALLGARLSPEDRAAARIAVLGNGIDTVAFDPVRTVPAKELSALPAPRLIFTGQMDYPPNIAAAERAISRLLPAIRARFAGASFHVVGRNPPPALAAQHGRDGAFVWGAVPEMPQWLAGADIALVPLELARGVQNKLLEAMAMALPVIATPRALAGIGVEPGREAVAAESDAELIEAVLALAADPARAKAIGAAARRFVVEKMSWDAALAPLAGMLGLAGEGARDAA